MISDNHVVQFHYTLKNTEGEVLESSREGEPMAYLHGYQNIIPGLEQAMSGKSVGEKFSVTIPPEDAYGMPEEGAQQRISVKHLQTGNKSKPKKWAVGMTAWVETDKGSRRVTIVKLGKFMVDVDFNHPLAGVTLDFDIEIVEVREAAPEELEHGHAHGVGGHHH